MNVVTCPCYPLSAKDICENGKWRKTSVALPSPRMHAVPFWFPLCCRAWALLRRSAMDDRSTKAPQPQCRTWISSLLNFSLLFKLPLPTAGLDVSFPLLPFLNPFFYSHSYCFVFDCIPANLQSACSAIQVRALGGCEPGRPTSIRPLYPCTIPVLVVSCFSDFSSTPAHLQI